MMGLVARMTADGFQRRRGSGSRHCCRRDRFIRWGVITRGVPDRDALDAILLMLRTGRP